MNIRIGASTGGVRGVSRPDPGLCPLLCRAAFQSALGRERQSAPRRYAVVLDGLARTGQSGGAGGVATVSRLDRGIAAGLPDFGPAEYLRHTGTQLLGRCVPQGAFARR